MPHPGTSSRRRARRSRIERLYPGGGRRGSNGAASCASESRAERFFQPRLPSIMIPRSSAVSGQSRKLSWGDLEHEESPARRMRGACARDRSGRGPAEDRQDRLHQHVQRPGRRDRQRHAQFLRARARSSRPQARRPAGRGHLRGRPDQARRRRAEDPEADRIRQGRFRRRLYLVERAAGLAEAHRRIRRPSRSSPTPAPRSSPASCARPTCSRPRGRTTRPRRRSAST